jgi:hypothetical protein
MRARAVVRGLFVLGLALASTSSGRRARADEPTLSPDRLKAAEEEYDAGRRAYLAEQFESAALHFENAFRDAPRAQVLRNAIRSRQQARQLARAATLAAVAKRRYAADPQTRDLAEDVLREAGPKLHEVRVTCSLPCSVGVDGRIGTLEEGTTAVLYLDPGKHALSFGFSKGRSVERAFEARAGAKDDLAVDAPRETAVAPPPPQGPAPSSAPPREAPPRVSSGLPPAVFFVGVGLTLAAGAATAISGADTLASPGKDAVREGCVGQGEDCELYKSGLAGELRTNIGLGLTGGLVVVTTVVGLFFTDWGASPAPAPKTSGLRLRFDGPRLRATF